MSFDDGPDSREVAPGESYSRRFTRPGRVLYHCRHHGDEEMIGAVVVR